MREISKNYRAAKKQYSPWVTKIIEVMLLAPSSQYTQSSSEKTMCAYRMWKV